MPALSVVSTSRRLAGRLFSCGLFERRHMDDELLENYLPLV